jgi:hypothetical protein
VTWFRVQTADRDPDDLIDPRHGQVSYHWSNSDSEECDRPGVSVCPSVNDLAAYLAQCGIPYGSGDWVIIELDGDLVEEVTPYDAEYGECLVWPTEIVEVWAMDDEFLDLIGAYYDEFNWG